MCYGSATITEYIGLISLFVTIKQLDYINIHWKENVKKKKYIVY